jgi:hypothetical protein
VLASEVTLLRVPTESSCRLVMEFLCRFFFKVTLLEKSDRIHLADVDESLQGQETHIEE